MGIYLLPPGMYWALGGDLADLEGMVDDVPTLPHVWSDGTRDIKLFIVLVQVPLFALQFGPSITEVGARLKARMWRTWDALTVLSSVSGPLQVVQGAEYWSVILALQAYSALPVGIDN